MGLDITYYRGLTRIENPVEGEHYEDAGDGYRQPSEGHTTFWINDDFPGRADDIDHDAIYKYEACEDFRAGSYGNYNSWRDQLAQVVGHVSAGALWLDPQLGPFMELICFADNEGTIGTVVSAKLAADFVQYRGQARTYAMEHWDKEGAVWFMEKYELWAEAFKTAADRGAVSFH